MMRPASRSTDLTYSATKGIMRSFSPCTTSTLVSPVSKSPSTLPRSLPSSFTTSRPTRSTQYSVPSSALPSDSRFTATSRLRSHSAPSRSSQPASLATGPFECSSKSSTAISRQPSGEATSQRENSPSPPGFSVKGFTLTQPCTPNGPTIRPITTNCGSSPTPRRLSPPPAYAEALLGGALRGPGHFLL